LEQILEFTVIVGWVELRYKEGQLRKTHQNHAINKKDDKID
jgi:hypothetical protein